jgi:hypothetical protein
MEEWAKLGDEHSAMLSYAFIPARSKKTNDLGEHLNHYRDTAFLHLFGRSMNSKSVKDALNTRTDRLPVAIHHFKPSVRAAVERNKSMTSQIERYRCTKEEGEGAGLTKADICKIKSRSSDCVYYLIPNNNYDDIKHELSIAKTRQSIIETASAPVASSKRKMETPLAPKDTATPTAGPIDQAMKQKYNIPQAATSTTKKRSPAERSFDNRCREIAASPQKYALGMDKMSERLDSMALTLHNLTLEREQMQQTHQQELEKLQTEFDN